MFIGSALPYRSSFTRKLFHFLTKIFKSVGKPPTQEECSVFKKLQVSVKIFKRYENGEWTRLRKTKTARISRILLMLHPNRMKISLHFFFMKMQYVGVFTILLNILLALVRNCSPNSCSYLGYRYNRAIFIGISGSRSRFLIRTD